MSQTTPGAGDGGRRGWPFERVDGGDPAGAAGGLGAPPAGYDGGPRDGDDGGPGDRGGAGDGGGAGRDGGPGGPGRRRLPAWLLVLLGVLVVAGVVAAVLVLSNRPTPRTPPPVADPEIVTLAPPTPSVDPVERQPGTAFSDTLPSVVLGHALTEIGEHEPLLAAGALEGYRLLYSDGSGGDVTVLAGQWRDAEGARAAFDAALAAAGVPPEMATAETAADAGEAPDDEAPAEPEGGAVEVDGAEVGRFVFMPAEDGATGTVWWTNGTVLLQATGPADAVRDLYAAYPL